MGCKIVIWTTDLLYFCQLLNCFPNKGLVVLMSARVQSASCSVVYWLIPVSWESFNSWESAGSDCVGKTLQLTALVWLPHPSTPVSPTCQSRLGCASTDWTWGLLSWLKPVVYTVLGYQAISLKVWMKTCSVSIVMLQSSSGITRQMLTASWGRAWAR